MDKIWVGLYHSEFDYYFIDEVLASYYETEQKTSRLIGAAMLIAIFISCLGLFGLVMFIAERKTKEIGIRKIIGADVADIVRLLCKDFIVLVGIAILIASPIAWWLMNRWLQDFAYRLPIRWWIFAIAGATVIVIALLTVSVQAMKAALANPVKSLRTE
jgi:putative ABC transport system permease protein